MVFFITQPINDLHQIENTELFYTYIIFLFGILCLFDELKLFGISQLVPLLAICFKQLLPGCLKIKEVNFTAK